MRLEELTAKALASSNIDRYQLALAVAKRSQQLEDGMPSKLNIDIKSMKSADLALMEIAEGVIKVTGFIDKE